MPERVVGAVAVQRDQMQEDHRDDDEGQQVVQRVEAVEGRIADGKAAPQQRHDALADQRDRREQVGDDGGGPVAHLAPGQHIAHEGGRDHQHQDDDAENPQQFARVFVRAVIKSAEQVDIDDRERTSTRRSYGRSAAASHN